jgi:RNA polymerase sigma-70 factor, ECF subfamily
VYHPSSVENALGFGAPVGIWMNQVTPSLPLRTLFEPNELAQRAQRGDRESFEQLVLHFRPRLVYLLAKRLRNTSVDPEDIAQECLLKAYSQLSQFDPKFQFSTWLFTIGFRTAIDAVRGNRRSLLNATVEWSFDTLSRPGHETEGESHMNSVEQVDRIWRIAGSVLTTSQFEVLWLRHGEEMSIPQIASVLKRTQVGVRVILFRGRDVLMKALEQDE